MSRSENRDAVRRLTRIADVAEELARTGVEYLPVRRVLELAGRLLPGQPAMAAEAERVVPDPRADPVTGCLPVTAPKGFDASQPEDSRPAARRR